MESISVINKRLVERFGVSIDGRANFRVVFSDTQYEKRYGTFEVYVGPLFLREETCLKEVPKYPYISGKHVLEELKYGDFPDQPFVTSSYEPLWTFMDKDRNALAPVWDAVEIVVVSRLEGTRRAINSVKRNFKQEEAEMKERDIQDVETILFGGTDGVHEMKNQRVNFVKPIFINQDVTK